MCILHNAVPVRLVHPAKSTKKRPACRRPLFAGDLTFFCPRVRPSKSPSWAATACWPPRPWAPAGRTIRDKTTQTAPATPPPGRRLCAGLFSGRACPPAPPQWPPGRTSSWGNNGTKRCTAPQTSRAPAGPHTAQAPRRRGGCPGRSAAARQAAARSTARPATAPARPCRQCCRAWCPAGRCSGNTTPGAGPKARCTSGFQTGGWPAGWRGSRTWRSGSSTSRPRRRTGPARCRAGRTPDR